MRYVSVKAFFAMKVNVKKNNKEKKLTSGRAAHLGHQERDHEKPPRDDEGMHDHRYRNREGRVGC